MEYVSLGLSDLKVSRICMGCMGFGDPRRKRHISRKNMFLIVLWELWRKIMGDRNVFIKPGIYGKSLFQYGRQISPYLEADTKIEAVHKISAPVR